MYPPNEVYTNIASNAFRLSLLDPTMLQPSSLGTALLFPVGLFQIEMGGDAGVFGSSGASQIKVPIKKTIITIGTAYGTQIGYAGDVYKDAILYIPFSVWTNTGATQDDTQQRLEFANGHRRNVFESYGLNLYDGQVNARPRPESPVAGLDCYDYRWRFQYCRE